MVYTCVNGGHIKYRDMYSYYMRVYSSHQRMGNTNVNNEYNVQLIFVYIKLFMLL